ncbi:hypothetical protein [Moorena sp. SIO3I6]|uniref:hypothetical protein n=1 Tax=Moorena sp. SIO3I6 TaxID=2607831 RepID=UPI0013FA2E52|nr:hypothetical protein [Moorena sp. SIO3I6]NEP24872.1 hypothetical protein [Moorena sp. SIO3I6]
MRECLFPTPCSLLPAPCSLFPVPCSLCYSCSSLKRLAANKSSANLQPLFKLAP